MKKWVTIQIVLPIILFFTWCFTITVLEVLPSSSNNTNLENSHISSENTTTADRDEQPIVENNAIIEDDVKNQTISDNQLKSNFIKACKECNIDVNQIKNLEKIADWNNGPRYQFAYSGNSFIVYAFDNGQIVSINLGDVKLYEDGFETLNVDDFLATTSTVTTLKVKSESIVKANLNFPDTASFSWLEWGSAKRYNYYIITGKVTAKNAFGVKDSLNFYIEYKGENNNWSVVYATLDNKTILGTKSQWPSVRKIEKQIDETNGTQDITLKYGIKGTYGKEDLFDGEKYIRYYLPSGKYTAEALVRNSIMYIETVKIHKEDGWDTSDILETIRFSTVGEKKSFEIKSGYCISLTINSQIKILEKIK